MNTGTFIVFCCDQGYFPLAKGLVLSILDKGALPEGIRLAFVNIGCDAASLAWLRERNVLVRELEPDIMGGLAEECLGYQRSQVCRPFLPKLFPDAKVLVWIDCDAWVQDASIFPVLRMAALKDPGKLFVAPEHHYSYTPINEDPGARRDEMYSYYEPTFGHQTASQMCGRATLNSGFFAMEADNALWAEWELEITRLFLHERDRFTPAVLHMAEQIALNVLAARGSRYVLLDPLYNYISLWTLPFRDDEGVVRVALPPHVPIGIVHLAGGWRYMGEKYFAERLLYRGGDYLNESEKVALFPPDRLPGYR